METLVTSINEGIAYYNDLYEWAKSFGDDPSDPDFDALSYMEGDPDMIRCDGYNLCSWFRTCSGWQKRPPG